jgi:hypothetical protein
MALNLTARERRFVALVVVVVIVVRLAWRKRIRRPTPSFLLALACGFPLALHASLRSGRDFALWVLAPARSGGLRTAAVNR